MLNNLTPAPTPKIFGGVLQSHYTEGRRGAGVTLAAVPRVRSPKGGLRRNPPTEWRVE